jgi:outer membrane protein TolC
MNYFRYTLLILTIQLLLHPLLRGQPATRFDPVSNEIQDFLPPLHVLIDSAVKNNSSIQFRELQVIVNQSKLRASRKEWTRSVGVQSDIRYGTFDNFSTNQSVGQTPATFATTRTEFKWGYAAYVNLPIFNLINRKNQIHLAHAELEQAESMVEVNKDELRQMVIRQYNELILQQRLLKIKSKLVETSKINMMMSEKEFMNGIIPISEYARISEIVSRAESDFEVVRIDFLTAYMILEEIVKVKFNLSNEILGTDDHN